MLILKFLRPYLPEKLMVIDLCKLSLYKLLKQ